MNDRHPLSHAASSVLKQVLDRVVAAVLLAPVLLLVAVACLLVKASSRGPCLYSQERIGLYGRPFWLLKIRTMHIAADQHALGNCTVQNDPRVFLVGKWLRKLKIDELPQVFQVLTGSMSLVGPRPTVAEDHQRMDDRQRQRVLARPGITGLAQVNGAAAIPWPERIEWDLRYLEGWSMQQDVAILAKTAILVFCARADKNPPNGDEWSAASDPQELASGQAA